ncbi:homoserine dehydrogenase [Leifsonia xyli subsp. cynodontis DSM 46306]|jgi:predicted SnoaL-like aldol condensation-catalyzing enzyme|uniref:SnoaL-like domain-containing protein n=1 Tax=Leifsonia xyli subsp. cynodontis DSM 46306 TaxID=1389489 RepID=U3P7W0_LEIXC|nr:nuclear transport factor 2 family protein [Leifsonia xyli]AGW41022.1 homoserine dehydrogenase [Leifsonia xyli subsp. cynodontis DSM 46306]
MTTTEDNKRIVTDYYLTAFAGNPEKAVADHLGDRYIQHNPQAENGPEAFIGFVHWMRGEYPDTKIEIKRVIAEGDLVVTHSHLVLVPGTPGSAVADFFRLENGKIVEHWDVVQEIPETSANDNTMF